MERVVCLSVNPKELDASGVLGQASQPQFLQATSPGKATQPSFHQSQNSTGNEDSVNASQEVTFRFLSGRNSALSKSYAKVLRTDAYFGKASVVSTTVSESISLPKVIGVVLITLVLLGVACMFIEEEDADDKANTSEHGLNNDRPAKPREELHAMETCPGTWAVTYQNAQGQSKQGLELLFRCHIIPTQEFAYVKVSQEHIDESVWIATRMLTERPLDQWLDDCPNALKGFDGSVRKNWEERTNVRLEKQTSKKFGAEDSKDLFDKQDTPAKGGTKASAPPTKEGRPSVLNLGDKKSLMDRCRQIMATSDAGRRPWSSMPESSTSAGQTAAPKRPPGMNTTPPSAASPFRSMPNVPTSTLPKDETREANDVAAPAVSKQL